MARLLTWRWVIAVMSVLAIGMGPSTAIGANQRSAGHVDRAAAAASQERQPQAGTWTPPPSNIITTVITSANLFINFNGGGLSGMAADGAGNVYLADTYHSRILEIPAGTDTVQPVGTGGNWYWPQGICIDHQGNIIVADSGHNQVKRISPTGQVTVVAGSGTAGYSGDGGDPAQAELNTPTGVAVDAADDIFVSDSANHVIREIASDGSNISTVVGTGSSGTGGDGGPATSATLQAPQGLAVDGAGNLYIADPYAYRIREVLAVAGSITSDSAITTFIDASPDTQRYYTWRPFGLTFDDAGNLFVSDALYGDDVVEVPAGSHEQFRVAGQLDQYSYSGDGGAASQATLSEPSGITLDRNHDLFIADSGNNVVRVIGSLRPLGVRPSPGIIDTVPETYQAGAPGAVAADQAGNLFIADATNGDIKEEAHGSGVITTVTGTAGLLNSPHGLAMDGRGDIFVADTNNNVVREIDLSGTVTTVAGSGTIDADNVPADQVKLVNPWAVALDSAGDLFITDAGHEKIREVLASNGVVSPSSIITTVVGTGDYHYNGDGGLAGQINLRYPEAISFDPSGDLLIADTEMMSGTTNENRILKVIPGASGITSASVVTTVPGLQGLLNAPSGVVADSNGDIFVADTGNNVVREVPAGSSSSVVLAGTPGTAGTTGDGLLAGQALLNAPTGLGVDATNNLFIADPGCGCVRVIGDVLAPPSTPTDTLMPSPSPAATDSATAPASAVTPTPTATTSCIAHPPATPIGSGPPGSTVNINSEAARGGSWQATWWIGPDFCHGDFVIIVDPGIWTVKRADYRW